MTEEERRFLDVLRTDIGRVYGCETLSLLLYVLALRERPDNVLELGTGLGATTAWIAAAMGEVRQGRLTTIDNGSQFPPDPRNEAFVRRFREIFPNPQTHDDYVRDLCSRLSAGNRVTYLQRELSFETPDELIESLQMPEQTFDWVFCDVTHSPRAVEVCLAAFLSVSERAFSLFIDSASTAQQSFLLAERLVDQLNRGKVPDVFNEFEDDETRERVRELARDREFSIHHFTEQVATSQNSTMLIKVAPVDSIPYPATFMR